MKKKKPSKLEIENTYLSERLERLIRGLEINHDVFYPETGKECVYCELLQADAILAEKQIKHLKKLK